MTKVTVCLKTWAQAKQKAQENPELLTSTSHSEIATRECVARMKKLDEAENALNEFRNQSDIPTELKNFFAGRDGGSRACLDCWVSSQKTKQHLECRRLIDDYFSSENALLKYVLSV